MYCACFHVQWRVETGMARAGGCWSNVCHSCDWERKPAGDCNPNCYRRPTDHCSWRLLQPNQTHCFSTRWRCSQSPQSSRIHSNRSSPMNLMFLLSHKVGPIVFGICDSHFMWENEHWIINFKNWMRKTIMTYPNVIIFLSKWKNTINYAYWGLPLLFLFELLATAN